MPRAHDLVQLFAADVTLRGDERVEDRLAWAGLFEAVAREVFRQLVVHPPLGPGTRWHRRARYRGPVRRSTRQARSSRCAPPGPGCGGARGYAQVRRGL